MVSGTEGELPKSKIDPMLVSVGEESWQIQCNAQNVGNWIHGRCTKAKKVSTTLAQSFVCSRCKSKRGIVVPVETLCDGIEKVMGFCYLGDRLNASGGSESAVTSRVRTGWLKFRECSEVLRGKRFSPKLKGKIYQSYVRSAMVYGSETWCLKEKRGWNFKKS